MNEPRECGWCDQIILDSDNICQSCGNIVDGSKLDQEIEEAHYKSIQDKIDSLGE